MIDEYEKWLKNRNYTSGTIKVSMSYARRIIDIYPDCKLPEDIDKVTENFQINAVRCSGSLCTLRGNIRRFAEFLGHEFK